MRASSLTSRLKRGVMVQNWIWWRLPLLLRIYVGAMPVAAIAAIGVAAAYTDWRLSDLAKFLVLVTCGMISVASTPKIMYTVGGGVTRDFSSIWVLPTAILLPSEAARLILKCSISGTTGLNLRRPATAAGIGR